MKVKKLDLNDLKVKSFVTDIVDTNPSNLKGGCPATQNCPTRVFCPTAVICASEGDGNICIPGGF